VTRTDVGDPMVAATRASAMTGDGPIFLRLEGDTLAAPFDGALHPDDHLAVEALLSLDADVRDPVLVRWLTPGADERYFEVAILRGREGLAIVHSWEVTAHIRQQQVLEHLALHDPLTGLANRVLFKERVRGELRRRIRTDRDVAVVYADLDGFKEINDTWGHAAGDVVLTTLADRLRECVRPGDVVARLGGDEFAICCPDLSGAEDATAVAHRLVDDATKPVPIGSTLVRVSVAVGVALAEPDEPSDGGQLIARADLAMYAAKGEGQTRVVLAASTEADREVG